MTKHYDFIEIGTSDFDTLIESSDDKTVGLSIEPIRYYLDRLPNKKNVKKIEAAVSDSDGFIEIYYIPDEKIQEHDLKWWIRGSNSIGRPHPFTVQELGQEFYNSIVKIEQVPTMSWKTLVEKEEIGSIGYLKIDTEGFDHIILNDYLKMCEINPMLFADKIKFERHTNVSNISEIDKVISKFNNYKVEYSESDVILKKLRIPKIIHQTFRTNELPEEIKISVESLKKLNPDFEYRFYNDEDCYNFIKENYDEETLALYSSINPNYGSCKADFFRYLLMYKVGGIYLDIKSSSKIPFKDIILSTDEYLLTHWEGRDWNKLLNYYHGEFQNWHIICRPEHPFLKKTIELVKDNIRNYHGQKGKFSVLNLSGPIVYSKAILSLIDDHKTYTSTSPVREFKYEHELNLIYKNVLSHHNKLYGTNVAENEPIILKTIEKQDKSYVLYSTENYFEIVYECVKSIREFSNLPIIVYLINSDKQLDISNTKTIRWNLPIEDLTDELYLQDNNNFYIDRKNSTIYKILIQRPLIVKHALENFSNTIAYVDSDSIATQYCDRIFEMYDSSLNYPYFVEGIYDYLHQNGRGGAESRDDLSTTLEHPACELFGVNQYIRQRYRQTGYFVAGQNTIEFLEEWYWMCSHPKILKNFQNYAPYHEETIANVLLWKNNKLDGLPYIYMNGSSDTIDQIFKNNEFTGESKHIGSWLRIPSSEKDLLFIHGEKRSDVRKEMVEKLKIRSSNIKPYPNITPEKNWGDVISHFLLEYFSGKQLKETDVFHFDTEGEMLDKNGKIVGIGSSMAYVKSNDYVWGTGCIDEFNIGVKPKKVYSVRGPLTRNLLIKRGWDVPEIYGDAALLFPRIYKPNIPKKYKYGLIPHYIDYTILEGLKSINHLEDLGIKIINITSEKYDFIDQILECEFILSSSLHGLIAADAYGIPNHRVNITELIHGGDFKYFDYYASVSRNHHTPLTLHPNIEMKDIESLKFEVGVLPDLDLLLKHSPWNDESCDYFNNSENKKPKVLFLAPHLSTGGMPGFLLKRIQVIKEYYKDVELFVAEHGFYSDKYIVQRNKIINLIGKDKFWSLGNEKMKLIDIIKDNNINIVHVDEMIEGFDSFNKVSNELMNALYDNNRTWRMVETCHNVSFNPTHSKKFHPDAYAFCTPYHKEVTFKEMPSYGEVLEFPIDNNFRTENEKIEYQKELNLDSSKIHVVNVGLWTSGKNQKEGIEIARHFENENVEFHFIGNQAPNFKEYWEPLMVSLPTNVRVWGERDDVDKFMKASDILMFNSTWECNPLVLREAASYGLKILARNLPQYVGMFDGLINPLVDDLSSNVQTLRDVINSDRNYTIEDGSSYKFASQHFNLYSEIITRKPMENIKSNTNINVTQYFINQPFLEITGESDSEFEIKFFDEEGVCHYENKLKSNHWVRLNREYFTKWNTKIWENGTLIYDKTLDYKNKRVLINFDSKSLGDNIAWIPYVLEFQNTHQCKVIVSTFWNHLFQNEYPELEFVKPGSTIHNISGQYNLGWFYNENKEPVLPNTIPLQQTATNILGLPFEEIKPKISYKIGKRPYEQKYVTIATNSTAGCKFWTKEGWQELINHLHSLGYKVINVSKEDNPFKHVSKIKDTSIENTMNVIHHSEFFIGLSSGLSWLAWGLGKHVVMISNFTEPNHEFTSNCTRISNLSVCNGCWNNPQFKFDKGDWNWCPVHKGTSRQFECHTSITSDMVIKQIQHLLK